MVCSFRIFQETREYTLHEIDIPGIVLQNFNAHAVFNGCDRCFDGPLYQTLQLDLCGVGEVYYYIKNGILHKGILGPDEKSAYGKVAGYPSVAFIFRGKLGFKPSYKPVVAAS